MGQHYQLVLELGMVRFETIIILGLVFGVLTTGSFGARILRNASPESDESNESDEKSHPFDALLKSLKKHAEDVHKQLQVRKNDYSLTVTTVLFFQSLASSGHESTKNLAIEASNHLDQAFSDIQENIAKIKANPIQAGDALLDTTSKKIMEMATNLSKAVEDMKQQGATLATSVVENVVEKSKQITEAAEKVMTDAIKKSDANKEPAAAA